jgi:hypothetical protein
MAPSDPVRIVDADGNPITSNNPVPISGAVTATVGELPAGTNNIGDVDVLTQPDSRESWRVGLVADVAANDSDKTLTVPAATEYEILSLYVTLATTADVGNRQLVVEFLSAADVMIGQVKAGLTQAASLTYQYVINPGVDNATAVWATTIVHMRLPHMVLSAGQKVRVYDSAAVAAAADDMTIQMVVAFRSVA